MISVFCSFTFSVHKSFSTNILSEPKAKSCAHEANINYDLLLHYEYFFLHYFISITILDPLSNPHLCKLSKNFKVNDDLLGTLESFALIMKLKDKLEFIRGV